ncbi:MAG: tetratricopeptide repeat protein, partial [Chitinophagaceae bacterium]
MGVVDGMLLKAANLYNRSKFDEALELLKKWEKPILETKDHVRISQLYALEANSYNSLYFTQKSRNCLLEAKKHAEKIVDDNTRYNNLAKVNMILSNTFEVNQDVKKNFDSILYYRKKAYEIQSKIVGGGILKTGAVIQASAIGNIFLKVDKIDSGKVYFERALSLIKQHQLEKFAFSTYIGLADIHFKNKRLDSALRYYLNAYQLAVKIENTSNIKDSYQKLYRTYMELGDSEKSLFYLKKYSSVADSLAQAGKNATKT